MRFISKLSNITYSVRVNSCLGQYALEEVLLRRNMRMRDRVRVTALINLHSLNDRMNAITVCYRIVDFFDDKGSTSLTTAISISRRIECLALT